MKPLMRLRMTGLATSLLAAALACGEEPPPPEPVVRPVQILELAGAGGGSQLSYPATIIAGKTADLSFEVPGRLIERPALEGEVVEQGQLLARLDPRDFEQGLAAETARMAAAKAERERAQLLFDEDVTSQQELDVKIRNYEITRARVAVSQKALDDTRLIAPFAGTVARIAVDNFETVQAKQRVMVLENTSLFEVKVAIPEQDASRISGALSLEEQTARSMPQVEISSIPGRRFPARITEFATKADPTTRTFLVTLRFDNPSDVNIRSGMTARVTVTVPDDVEVETGIRIPANAIVSPGGDDAYVWTIDPGTLEASRRDVELGELGMETVLVRSGLEGNEWIAISGVHHLHEGMVVSRLQK